MIDIAKIINEYCFENKITVGLSLEMPSGYETANGMYDDETKMIYMNPNIELPEYEQAFYLYHELRHALQYNQSEGFSDELIMSLGYVIMFDGTCYKNIDGRYFECRIEGEEDYLSDLYKGQLYEADANHYAYETVKKAYGDIPELKELYDFFRPARDVSFDEYKTIYQLIDEKIQLMLAHF